MRMPSFPLFLLFFFLGFLVIISHAAPEGTDDRKFISPSLGFSYTYPLELIRNTQDFRARLKAKESSSKEDVVFSGRVAHPRSFLPTSPRMRVPVIYQDVVPTGARLMGGA